MIKYQNTVFIDSGAHGLYNEFVINVKDKTANRDKYAWFSTKEFWNYIDTFADFVKANKDTIDVFANVDVIFNPELTWKSQMYLEKKHGITPLPVIHFNTPFVWLERYLARGYDYIALGGLGQEAHQGEYKIWADEAFNIICDKKTKLPKVKVHGFAMTSHPLMVRYPWYSVDSTSWLAFGSYGQIIVPPWRNGKWDYDTSFDVYRVSMRQSKTLTKDSVLVSMKGAENAKVLRYIKEKGFVLGESVIENGEEKIISPGLCNDDVLRCNINSIYFLDFAKSRPAWPWPFVLKDEKQKPLL